MHSKNCAKIMQYYGLYSKHNQSFARQSYNRSEIFIFFVDNIFLSNFINCKLSKVAHLNINWIVCVYYFLKHLVIVDPTEKHKCS